MPKSEPLLLNPVKSLTHKKRLPLWKVDLPEHEAIGTHFKEADSIGLNIRVDE
jgi:hypothetical protein